MSDELPRSLKIVTAWLLAGLPMFLGVQWWPHRAQQARFSTSGQAVRADIVLRIDLRPPGTR